MSDCGRADRRDGTCRFGMGKMMKALGIAIEIAEAELEDETAS